MLYAHVAYGRHADRSKQDSVSLSLNYCMCETLQMGFRVCKRGITSAIYPEPKTLNVASWGGGGVEAPAVPILLQWAAEQTLLLMELSGFG